jgi:hypothetical protein
MKELSIIMYRLRIMIAVALGYLLLLPATYAQDADAISLIPDAPQQVQIQPEQPARLIFTVSDDDAPLHITVSAQAIDSTTASDAPPFDPVLMLQAPSGEQIAYNDDTYALLDDGTQTINQDARLEAFHLPVAGTYTIIADSFNGVSTGDVNVRLTVVDPFRVSLEEISTEGDGTHTRIEGVLPAGRVYQHTLELSAGDILTVTARDQGHTLDPLLRLLDSTGTLLIENDDHNSYRLTLDALDARISRYRVPDDATYTLHLLDFTGGTGFFSLEICQNTETCP